MLQATKGRLIQAAALAALTWSCSSGGDDGPVTPPRTPSIAFSLVSPTMSISQASAGTVVATVARNGGFEGNVNLTIEGAPAGVSGAFTPASLPNGTTSSTLTLNVTAAAVPATVNLTVRARGTGVTDQTAALALTVTPAPVPAFTLTLAPAAVVAVQGTNATTTVTVTGSGGFAGQVAFTVTGAPAGVTATFNPTSVAGNLLSDEAGASAGVASVAATNESDPLAAAAAVLAPSTLTLAVAGTVAPGAYPLTVRGNSAGQTERNAALTLTVTAAAVPAYTLALSPTALTLQQGANGPVTANLTREAGFVAAVALSAENLPTGVTAAFVPASVTTSTSALTVTVGATVAAGNYPITVRGTTAGLADRTATLTLTVTAAPPNGYTLAVAPSPVTIVQGANGTSTATLTRLGGNAASVALSATGMPAGMTVTFNPASTTGTTSTATIAVGAAVAPGNYTLTVRGTATGLTDQTAQLAITVTAAPVGGGNVAWTFCEAANRNPVWFARQDNNGAWTQVAGVNNVFSFNITGGRGGVAYVLPGTSATDYTLTVLYGTTAELTAQGTSTCLSSSPLKTVNGSVSGLTGVLDQAWITLGGSVAIATFATPTFSLTTVPDGARDLIATFSQRTIANPLAPAEVKKMIIRRGINPAAGSTLPALDFAGAEAFTPVTRNLTIGGATGATTSFVEFYVTSNSGSGLIYNDLPGSMSPNRTYYGVPAANQSPGDLHGILASAANTATNGTSGDTRSVIKYFKDAVDQTINVGPTFSTVAVTTLGTAPYVRFRSSWSVQSEYNRYFFTAYDQSSGAQDRTANVSATAGYLGALGAVTLDIPDFTGVAGWLNAYGPVAGVQTMWFSSGAAWTTTGVVGANPAEGISSTTGQRFGQITP